MFAFGLAILSALSFAIATPASKALLGSLPPFQLAGLLYLGAALGMTPGVVLERRAGAAGALDRSQAWHLVAAVLLGGVVAPVLVLMALRASLAGSVALLLNLEGVATAVLGTLFFREHLGRLGWLGAAGAVAAGSIVAVGGGAPGLVGGALTSAACLCWALDNHFTALIDRITPTRSTFVKGLVAGSANLAIGLAIAPLDASPPTILIALAVGIVSYGISIQCYVHAAHAIGATRAQAVFGVAPFLAAGLSYGFLAEPIGSAQLFAVPILAVSVVALFSSRHAHLHDHPALEHAHMHRHDDGHHDHAHPELDVGRHMHPHRHAPISHSHPHLPDLHHRHDHPSD